MVQPHLCRHMDQLEPLSQGGSLAPSELRIIEQTSSSCLVQPESIENGSVDYFLVMKVELEELLCV